MCDPHSLPVGGSIAPKVACHLPLNIKQKKNRRCWRRRKKKNAQLSEERVGVDVNQIKIKLRIRF